MDQDGNAEIWDFTVPDLPKRFKVDNSGEVFEAPAVLGPKQLVGLVRGAKEIARLVTAGDEEAMIGGVNDLFLRILTRESGPLFVQRINDEDRPVDIQRQILPILNRLMEAYGLRPTQPSANSSSSPDDTGTSSTDGPPPAESIPSSSPADGSST